MKDFMLVFTYYILPMLVFFAHLFLGMVILGVIGIIFQTIF